MFSLWPVYLWGVNYWDYPLISRILGLSSPHFLYVFSLFYQSALLAQINQLQESMCYSSHVFLYVLWFLKCIVVPWVINLWGVVLLHINLPLINTCFLITWTRYISNLMNLKLHANVDRLSLSHALFNAEQREPNTLYILFLRWLLLERSLLPLFIWNLLKI